MRVILTLVLDPGLTITKLVLLAGRMTVVAACLFPSALPRGVRAESHVRKTCPINRARKYKKNSRSKKEWPLVHEDFTAINPLRNFARVDQPKKKKKIVLYESL